MAVSGHLQTTVSLLNTLICSSNLVCVFFSEEKISHYLPEMTLPFPFMASSSYSRHPQTLSKRLSVRSSLRFCYCLKALRETKQTELYAKLLDSWLCLVIPRPRNHSYELLYAPYPSEMDWTVAFTPRSSNLMDMVNFL